MAHFEAKINAMTGENIENMVMGTKNGVRAHLNMVWKNCGKLVSYF